MRKIRFSKAGIEYWSRYWKLGVCSVQEILDSLSVEMEVASSGEQIQVEDPDGGPIELFEPAQRGACGSYNRSESRLHTGGGGSPA